MKHLEAVTGAENVRRGACAKLTPEEVAVIRTLYAAGYSGQQIASDYPISRQQVYHIATRKRWAAA